MTLPSSGSISMSQVSTEIGNPPTASMNMAWIRDNSKTGAISLAAIYGMSWYARNVDGNCNNGNCTANCNCGSNCVGAASNCGFGITPNCNCTALNCNAVDCSNCLACNNVNCANCDGRAWLQGNCNCACTYNCNTSSTVSVNCSGVNCNCSTACDCNCNCNCTNCTNCSDCGSCFPAGTLVLMADLTWKRIDYLSIGDMMMGANGKPARIIQIETPTVGTRRVYEMPDAITGTRSLYWTEEHRYRVRDPKTGVNNWWVASLFEKIFERYLARTHKVMGSYDHVTSRKLIDNTWSGPGFEFEAITGYKPMDAMVDATDKFLSNTRVYDVVTDTGSPVVVEGFVVSGYTPDDFQFTTHQIEPQHVRTATRNFEAGQGIHSQEAA